MFVEDSSSDEDLHTAQVPQKRKTVNPKRRNDQPSIRVNSDSSESEGDTLIPRRQQQERTKPVPKNSKREASTCSNNSSSEDDVHILKKQRHDPKSSPSDKVTKFCWNLVHDKLIQEWMIHYCR